jgi:hypothetical protein
LQKQIAEDLVASRERARAQRKARLQALRQEEKFFSTLSRIRDAGWLIFKSLFESALISLPYLFVLGIVYVLALIVYPYADPIINTSSSGGQVIVSTYE